MSSISFGIMTVRFSPMPENSPLFGEDSVTLTAGADSVTFMPNGVSPDNVMTLLQVTASGISDSVMINQVGKVVR